MSHKRLNTYITDSKTWLISWLKPNKNQDILLLSMSMISLSAEAGPSHYQGTKPDDWSLFHRIGSFHPTYKDTMHMVSSPKLATKRLHLCQPKYILDLLHCHNMVNAKPITMPMVSSPKLTILPDTSIPNQTEYRRLVDSLQYLAFTRSDIASTENKLSQFIYHSMQDHCQATK